MHQQGPRRRLPGRLSVGCHRNGADRGSRSPDRRQDADLAGLFQNSRSSKTSFPAWAVYNRKVSAGRRLRTIGGRYFMSLEIHLREHEGVAILDLDGRLTVGNDVATFRERMQKLIESGQKSVILNLDHVDYVDSTGLGALVMGYTTLQRAGGKVKLLNLSRRSIELLVMTKLTTIFEVFDQEQDAVNSFFPDREIKRFDILSFVKRQKEE